jgi:hypothetical protein
MAGYRVNLTFTLTLASILHAAFAHKVYEQTVITAFSCRAVFIRWCFNREREYFPADPGGWAV